MDAEDDTSAEAGIATDEQAGASTTPGALDLGWAREGRRPTVGEAREYFDTHADTGGDPELMLQCERVLDATRHSAGVSSITTDTMSPPSFPPAPDDQLEEKGAD